MVPNVGSRAGFSVVEVIVAMVVLSIAVTVTTVTLNYFTKEGQESQKSNYGFILTKQKLLQLQDESFMLISSGADTVSREGTDYIRSWEINDTVSPAEIAVQTVWKAGSMYDTASLMDYIKKDICPDIEQNEAPDSLQITNDTGATIADSTFPIIISDKLGKGGFVANLIGHDPDSAAGDIVTLSLPDTLANDSFSISSGKLKTADNITTTGSYEVAVELSDCFDETYRKAFFVRVVEKDTLIIVDDTISIEETTTDHTPTYGVIHTMQSTPSSGVTWNMVSSSPTGAFGISESGDITVADASLIDCEGANPATVTVEGAYNSLTEQGSLLINITNINEPPTDITLSDNEISIDSGAGAVIGTFTTQDVDDDEHNYIVAGSSLFTVTDDSLRLYSNVSESDAGDYTITVTATDEGSLSFEKGFVISLK